MKLFGAMEIKENELFIGGISSTELVNRFGSPLYVICLLYTSPSPRDA